MTRLGFYDKMRERFFKGISSHFKGDKSLFDDKDLTIRLPKGEVEAWLQELFTVPIEKSEVIEPNQIVGWRRREGLENPIDCLIMYDYDDDDDEQKVVFLRTQKDARREDLTWLRGGEFRGKEKTTPKRMSNGWITGYPYRVDAIYYESRTLNFSKRGFLN